MLLIMGPILLFFVVCLPIDYYFFKKRKQESREQQGMVYHRELRRVGMTRASMDGTVDEPDSPDPSGAFGSLRNHITRFKSLIGILSLKRKVTGRGVDQENPKQEKEVDKNESSSSKSGLDIITESETDSESERENSSVNMVRGIRPILNRVTDIKGALMPNEPMVLTVCPTETVTKRGQAPVKAKLPPINQVHPAEDKRQLYAKKRTSYQNMTSGEKCAAEPIALPLSQSVHI